MRDATSSISMSMRYSVFPSTLLVFCLGAGLGWAQSPDVNQLKAKLAQLDQMMQDLRQEIANVEAAQKAPGQPLVATTSPQPSKAPETQQLPVDYTGSLTRRREVANGNPDGAPRINNED